MASKLWLWLVVEFLNSLATVAKVDDEKGLALVHKTDHHDFIFLCIWEFKWIF